MPVTKKQYTDIDINFNKNPFTSDVSVKLNDNVTAQLAVYEPRVKLDKITWDETYIDSNELSITVDFFIRKGTQSKPQQQSLKIEISKVR